MPLGSDDWSAALRSAGLTRGADCTGTAAARVGELAGGTPYVPGTLDAYLAGGRTRNGAEPLTLSLTRFDCVTLVESCLAVARRRAPRRRADLGPLRRRDRAHAVPRGRPRGTTPHDCTISASGFTTAKRAGWWSTWARRWGA